MTYFFEDVQVGWKHDIGPYEVNREDVIAFAERFDPQPFHLDEAAASNSFFGRIAASGLHTCSMAMRMIVDHQKTIPGWTEAASGALGIDELRFHRPVYPGDLLRGTIEIEEKLDSRSMPDLGILRVRVEIMNQASDRVLSYVAAILHKRRPAAVRSTQSA